jgi:adenylate cyclase
LTVDPNLSRNRPPGFHPRNGVDTLLAEFERPSDAVTATLAFQADHTIQNSLLEDDLRAEIRVGIAMGEVVIADNTVTGAGVVLAQRIEQLADPGGLCITSALHEALPKGMPFDLEDLGEHELKGFDHTVRVYRVDLSVNKSIPPPELSHRPASTIPRWAMIAIVAVAVVIAIGVANRFFPATPMEKPALVKRMAFPLPDKPSIAVLPFTNMSDDKDQGYFADGITEDIITDISKVSGIFVVARNSTFTYKGRAVKVGQVAEDLGVRYVLKGSVRRAGGKLRITAQLVDAVRGYHLWAERYDRDVEDVFAVQTEVTRHVVKAMAVTLKANEQDRLFQKYATNIDAYDTFLRARATVEVPTRENIENGEKLFKETIELDPNFAGGYAGLSFNYSVKARFRYGSSREEDATRALAFAQKAIGADKSFAWSHIALAGAYLANGQHDAAVDAAQQALVIQPSGYEANLFKGFYLFWAGQSALSVKHLEVARNISRIDSNRGLDFLGIAYFMDRKYARSEGVWIKAFETFGVLDHSLKHVFLAASQASLNKMDDAAATVERFHRLRPTFRLSKWPLINNFRLPENRKRIYDAAIKAGIPE